MIIVVLAILNFSYSCLYKSLLVQKRIVITIIQQCFVSMVTYLLSLLLRVTFISPIIILRMNLHKNMNRMLVYETSRLKNNTLLLLINYSSYVGGWGNVLAMSCSFVLIVLNSSTDSLDVLRYKIIM